MYPAPSADVVLQQVRRLLQEVVEQMLTIAERLCTAVQQLAPASRTPAPPPGNGFFAAYTPRETRTGSQYQQTTSAGLPNCPGTMENALWGEYRRAERAEKELADLRARYATEKEAWNRKLAQPPTSELGARDRRSAKRPRQEQGRDDAPTQGGKAKRVACPICDAPHSRLQCRWREGLLDDDSSEEDPSEEKSSGTRPAEPDSPIDVMDDSGTLPTGYRPHGTPEDDGSPDPRVRRRFAVRHWPPGCGRNLHSDPDEDALPRGG